MIRRPSLLALLTAAPALAAPAAARECTCTNDIPIGLVIEDSMKLESGEPPTEFVGVFGIFDETVSHANEFVTAEPFTITHVCVVTDPQNGNSNPMAEIRIKDHDDGLDAPDFDALHTTPFEIETSLLEPQEQVVELETPVIVSGHFWVEVAYFATHGGFAHQGVRPVPVVPPIPTTRSMVRVGDLGEWFDYEDPGVYGEKRAIIRLLELGPEPVPACQVFADATGLPQTGEGGAFTTLSISLSSPPTTPVVVAGYVPLERGVEGMVLDPVAVFDLFNWSTPQTMTVVGLDDALYDGDQGYSVHFEVNSANLCYDGFVVPPVPLVNLDDEKGPSLPIGPPERRPARRPLFPPGPSGPPFVPDYSKVNF